MNSVGHFEIPVDNAAGGELVLPKRQIGDMGWCAYFKDTEGNTLEIWENNG